MSSYERLERLAQEIAWTQKIIEVFIKNSPHAFIVVNEDGKVMTTNNVWEHYLGLEPQDMIDKDIRDFLSPEHADEFMDNLTKVPDDKNTPDILSICMIDITGRPHTFEWNVAKTDDGCTCSVVRKLRYGCDYNIIDCACGEKVK